MKYCKIAGSLLAVACMFGVSFSAEEKSPSGKWERDIQAFEKSDKSSPPPEGAVLFIGASNIVRWDTLAKEFPEHRLIIRGFGGSHIADAVYYADRIVVPYKPKMIVLDSGGNDLGAGKSPETVFADFQAFVEKVHAKLPDTGIAYISRGPSSSPDKGGKTLKFNQLVKEYVAKHANLNYIEAFDSLAGPDGLQRPDLYVSDKVHFSPAGYKIRAELVRPYLERFKVSSAGSKASVLAVDVGTIDRERILKASDTALKLEAITITAFRAERSAGGLNDFYSEADYSWPDPDKANGQPFINKDGMSYPGVFSQHRMAMRNLRDAVAALGAAYRLTGEERYAEKAAKLLGVFFLDPATRMNPHLEYAQAIRGKSPGRSFGIIDALHLIEIPPAITAMQKSPAFKPELMTGLKKWFADLSEWMVTSKNGREEANAKNNHAVAYWLQMAVFARFTGDEAKLAECRRQFKEVFLVRQMELDGSFPAELKRTKPYGYSIFQLENMVTLCQVLSTKEDNLWTFQTPDGKNIRKGMEYLYPYLADKSEWPLKQDIQAWEGWPSRQSCLLFAGIAFSEQKYLDLWKQLKPDPESLEVKRNIAITQPVLWLLN